MILIGKKVILRAIETDDLEMLKEMVNDPEIESMVGGWSFPVSDYQQKKWYESIIFDSNNIRLVVESLDKHEALGMISLTNIDWKNRSAEYAIKLSKATPKKKGYASDAEFTLFKYAFEELQLNRLSSEVLDYNVASIVMTEKCGAKREGLKRKAIYKNGCYHDVICYGVLYEDYLAAIEKQDA